jgi:lysophospholipase L1-like esterase
MADAVHPNDAGHAIIADRIEPALRAALSAAGG